MHLPRIRRETVSRPFHLMVLFLRVLMRHEFSGPQKGYKSKRRRTEGDLQDGREASSVVNAPEAHSHSPFTNGAQDRLPAFTERSAGGTERPPPPPAERSGDDSASPPPRDTSWSAMRTDLSRERPVASLPRRAETNAPSATRTEEDPPRTTERDGAASPDIGMAISALESLHEERNYTPHHQPTVARDDDDPTAHARQPSPRGQSRHLNRALEHPRRGQAIPCSVPASSRNSDDGLDTRCHDPNGLGKGASSSDVRIDRQTQDRLLAIYWTHIHVSLSRSEKPYLGTRADRSGKNVWPLLYKPEFYPSTVHRPLLLAMLAAASAIPTPGKTILNAPQAEQLFTQAQDAVLRRARSPGARDQFDEIAPAAKSSLQTVQCLILFSLRQTSGGNKSSAYLWFCHAAAMALELGLHRVVLDKSKQSQVSSMVTCRGARGAEHGAAGTCRPRSSPAVGCFGHAMSLINPSPKKWAVPYSCGRQRRRRPCRRRMKPTNLNSGRRPPYPSDRSLGPAPMGINDTSSPSSLARSHASTRPCAWLTSWNNASISTMNF